MSRMRPPILILCGIAFILALAPPPSRASEPSDSRLAKRVAITTIRLASLPPGH